LQLLRQLLPDAAVGCGHQPPPLAPVYPLLQQQWVGLLLARHLPLLGCRPRLLAAQPVCCALPAPCAAWRVPPSLRAAAVAGMMHHQSTSPLSGAGSRLCVWQYDVAVRHAAACSQDSTRQKLVAAKKYTALHASCNRAGACAELGALARTLVCVHPVHATAAPENSSTLPHAII
jgi:hypothetical protein